MSRQIDAVRRFLAANPTPSGEGDGGNVVVVAGGKGGIGTSTTALLLASAAAEAGARTLLMDAADGTGTLDLMLGLPESPGLGGLRGGAAIGDVVVRLGDGLDYLRAGAEPSDRQQAAERRALYRRAVVQFAVFDLVVIDAGSRLGTVTDVCEHRVARVLAVTTGERVACAAAYALIKVLGDRFPSLRVDLVVNRAEGAPAYAAIRAAAGGFLQRVIALAAVLPDDPILRAAIEGQSGLTAISAGPAGDAARELSLDLLQLEAADAGGEARNRKV